MQSHLVHYGMTVEPFAKQVDRTAGDLSGNILFILYCGNVRSGYVRRCVFWGRFLGVNGHPETVSVNEYAGSRDARTR
jgi:hypothetical protein